MGLFSFLKKQIVGEDGMKVLDRYPKWVEEVNKYSRKDVKLVIENRKLQLEGAYLRRYVVENDLLILLDEKYVYSSPVGELYPKNHHIHPPTEEHFQIYPPTDINRYSFTWEQKKILDEFGFFEDSKSLFFIFLSRKELYNIITTLGGKRQEYVDKFYYEGNHLLTCLISKYNDDLDDDDNDDDGDDYEYEYQTFDSQEEKIQETYSNGIRYISIWSFKRINRISPNTNETNYQNSQEIFYKYPTVKTIEIEIDNSKFEYVLGYPEEILVEYFKV